MRILDRYILKSALAIFLTCLLVFLFLYIIIDLFSNLDEILKQKVALNFLLEYYLAFLPIIFVQVTPVASLVATLYTFARLNRDNEIIAMRASGLSIFGITKTVIIFGTIISIFVFWVNDRFVPSSLFWMEKTKEQIETNAKKTQEKEHEVIDNLSMYGAKNRLFFVNKFYYGKNIMEGITILVHDDHQNITKKIVANKGVYRGGLWRFYQSITYNFDENSQIVGEPLYFEEEIMAIPETPQEFLSQRERTDLMTIAQLDDYIWKLSKSGATTVIRNLKVDLYQRFTSPLTSLIIILLGIPFSIRMKKRATGLSSLGLSVMMGFLYYVLNAVSIALGKSGILMPILSSVLAHIIVLTFSLYLIATLP